MGIRLFLSGDVMTGRGIDQILPHPCDPELYERHISTAREYVRLAEEEHGPIEKPVSYGYVWGEALSILSKQDPDLRLINLETSITRHSEPREGKGIHYRMSPDNIDVLTEANIDVVSLANNHVLDWNERGLLETLDTLEAAGISYAGAGRSASDASSPVRFHQTDEARILITAAGSGDSGIPRDWLASSEQPGVQRLERLTRKGVEHLKSGLSPHRQPGDLIVASLHWGGNWGYEVPEEHQQFARWLIDDAGVDVIHGHSSHHPRGIEVYRGKPILYGAGDLINDYEGIGGREQYRGDLRPMYFLDVDPVEGLLESMEIVPLKTRKLQLVRAPDSDVRWLRDRLDRECQKWGCGVERTEEGCLKLIW